ncbi:helix-turn-helix transcriptional regulator [Nocardioides caeni]|uniref:WYL domain-containing protein n=1 Tax=Nocardioides caeni TaxID=574700 RepID=A0A4S8NNG5_9ACTN|nr:WYL domain-containing protein [Nocardioides caeni]THV18135.1 WYL domain-containing protein [Nocardioides caeni]
MERLVRVAAMLQRHPINGVSGEELAELAGFAGGADAQTQLKRDLNHLERQGWQIENLRGPGEPAVYRMRTVDNRLRFRLTPQQQSALRRAVLLADRSDLAERLGLPEATVAESLVAQVPAQAPRALDLVVDAVREHRVLEFAYKGTARVVHPESVRNRNGAWYLSGVERDDLPDGQQDDPPLLKTFVVTRMSGVVAGARGSAETLVTVRHSGLHPMTWEIDEPVEVVLETASDFEPDVRRWLGEPVSSGPVAGDLVHLTYRVTHRAALRARLNELGRRVRVVGPAEVRAEVVAALAEAAGLAVSGQVPGQVPGEVPGEVPAVRSSEGSGQ